MKNYLEHTIDKGIEKTKRRNELKSLEFILIILDDYYDSNVAYVENSLGIEWDNAYKYIEDKINETK